MEAERWQRIEEVFQGALDCGAEQRGAFLASACGGDPQLRSEVESLLTAYAASGATESAAFQEASRILEHRSTQAVAGTTIGPYRVIRELGHGGMGTVFLAARADKTFEKLVAIKVIRPGLDTDQILQRFRSERQILATLDHPNITRLLDGGTTEDGLPYFVMEFIEGEPIDQYCDARKFGVNERLGIFQGVCAAVSYAHQHLVIHRDIKPDNVLVTKEGVPRLLDFGIAKLLTPGTSTAETLTTLRPLTPEFASPEQIRGEPITTGSDVYALGVLLYRLLSGSSPYGSANSQTELERAICEREPERPSAVVEDAIASASGEATDKLRRRLKGDLDNIVLRAMRKEPQRRYASADQLSQDITRYLTHLPVAARPDTARYRAAKFIRRHAAGVAVAVLVLVTLTAGIAATLWQAHSARQQRDRARQEKAKADRINSFLQDMLTYTSPEYTSSNASKIRDAKVSEVVDQAAKRAESELADQTEVLASVLNTLGGVYATQGRVDEALPILRKARDLTIRTYGLNSHETTEVSGTLANVLLMTGKHDEAEAMFKQDIQIEKWLEQHGHANLVNLAYVYGGLGGMLDQKQDPAAKGYLEECLKYAKLAFTGKDRVFVAITENNLSNEAGYRGDADEAERYARMSLDEYRHLPPGTYGEMGVTLSNLGRILTRKGNYEEGEKLVRESLDLRRKVYGDSNPATAAAWYALSDLLYREAKYDEAAGAANESVAVFKRSTTTPQKNVIYANPLMQMGLILDKQRRYHEAEPYFREALEIRTHFLKPGNQLLGVTQGGLGECLMLQKRYAQAEPLLLDSYRTIEATTPASDPRRTEAAQRLVNLYQGWGKAAQAAKFQTVSVAARTK
jgi:eukaryotic-like serine/threonine-protein kinase